MATKTTARLSARERLLAAADELFYAEGLHSVGIDRVIEHAGVAKASLYNAFGSKDDLVVSYLEGRRVARDDRLRRHMAKWDNPRDKALSIFDALGEAIAEPTYHGCAFQKASAERGSGRVADVCNATRDGIRSQIRDLLAAAGAADPDALALRIILLYDGANVSARMDHDVAVAAAARAAAETLLDAAGI
jgi:AcrR family transcriptional regulator